MSHEHITRRVKSAEALARILKLTRILQRLSGPVTIQQLAETMRAERRTIECDISIIKQAGGTLYYDDTNWPIMYEGLRFEDIERN